MLICPVCKKRLIPSGNSFVCTENHSFDLSKSGYLHLLTSKGRNPKLAGDNAEMVKSRSAFLDKGYYQPLAEKIAKILADSFESKGIVKPVIIDSGCGEGFYTTSFCKSLPAAYIYGLDISKNAVNHAAKRASCDKQNNAFFCVASSFELPFKSGCADAVISIFAPVCNDEYSRVLKKKGRLFVAAPNADHLFGLKEALYEKPYKNKPNEYNLTNFKLEKQHDLRFEITLDCNNDIQSLFKMTPYYYKTSIADTEKLNSLNSLKTVCDFCILEYVKIK